MYTLDFVNCFLKDPLACSLGSMAQGNLAGTRNMPDLIVQVILSLSSS